MYCKEAIAATNWWIEQIKKRCIQVYPNKVTRDGSNLVIIDDKLAEDLSRFENILINEFQKYIEKNHYIILTCCHFPNSDLKKLAQKAGFSTTYFTFRAEMRIFGKSIQVSLDGNDLTNLPLPAE